MSQNNMPYTDGLGNYDRVQHAREEALWAPLSPGERRQWSQGLIDFRPDAATPMTNRMLDSMMGRYGVISLESWVKPLLAFDAAGFSAQDWLEIMTSLHVLLAQHPERVMDNPAVTLRTDYAFTSRVAIEPEAWRGWLPIRRSGASALSATQAVLRAAKPRKQQASTDSVRNVPTPSHEGTTP
jgi:hypothetical protein